MNKKTQGFVDRQTKIYLKFLIPNIRNQVGHETFSWDDAIDYLIKQLNEMRDNE